MLNNEFEKTVQQDLEELSLTPSDAVWNKVEASLPEKKRRRWLLLLLPVLMAVSIMLLWNDLQPAGKNEAGSTHAKAPIQPAADHSTFQAGSAPVQKAADAMTSDSTASSAKETRIDLSAGNEALSTMSDEPRKPSGSFAKTGSAKQFSGPTEFPVAKASSSRRTKTATKITIAAPGTDEDAYQQSGQLPDSVLTRGTVVKDSAETISQVPPDIGQPTLADIPNSDSAAPVAVTNEKKKKNRWQLGIAAGAGMSDMKGGLFGKSAVDADFGSAGGTPIGTPGVQATVQAPRPAASLAFSIGAFAEKAVDQRLTFHADLSYTRYATVQKQGPGNDSLSASRSSETFRNKYHFIILAASLQYKPVPHWPVYADAGVTGSCLLKANALVYDGARHTFIKDPDAFNKMLFGIQAGAGVKLPFGKVGYRFSYSISPVSKAGTSRYPVSSMIYFQLPLKK